MKVYARIPLDLQQVTVPQGQVYLIPERCKGCGLCIEFCPEEVFQVSTGLNAKGYHYPQVAPGKEEACVHCGFCTLVCPEFAIFTLLVEPEVP
ncbi:MAG: 4Fe-4S dicluster domain-containing protein [Anaerolineae bacterium]|nr:4Fe-4S dicluster domain-containing protein [Anaerolineae bacterium]